MERQENANNSDNDLFTTSSTSYYQSNQAQKTLYAETVTGTQTIAIVVLSSSATPTNNGNSNSNNGDSNSSISRGPSTTTSALPTTQSNNQQGSNNQQSSGGGLSGDSKRAIIISVASSVGGVIILAVLLYICCRRRRGATYSEIAHFRPHSNSTVVNTLPEQDQLTALPIYRNDRFSVKSSRHDSVTNFSGRNVQKAPPPPPLKNPLGPNAWKSAHPPKTPSPDNGQDIEAGASPSESNKEADEPEMSINKISGTTGSHPLNTGPATGPSHQKSQQSMRSNGDARSGEWPLKDTLSPDDSQDPERWSWTNSQAPPTPRIAAPNARSSLQSYRGRSISAWVRGQSVQEEQSPPQEKGSSSSKLFLKNHASVPKLASPRPGKNQSKEQDRVSSLSAMLKSNKDRSSPPGNQSPQPDSRPSTTTTTVETAPKNKRSDMVPRVADGR